MGETRQTINRRATNRWTTAAGLLCLAASLLLSSSGVRTVRAEGADETLMSVDPKLEARLEAARPVEPAPSPVVGTPPSEIEPRPGEPAVEIQPGVIVLNTRGYNYGPPVGETDPAALDHETAPAHPAR